MSSKKREKMKIILELEDIKKMGLNASTLFSYLKAKARSKNIRSENFFSVKLKDIKKDLGLKRVSLKNSIDLLQKMRLISFKAEKKTIFTNVSFSISHGAVFDDNTASKPLKTGVEKYDNTASSPVLFSTTTAHKHGAASICPVINKLITLKATRFSSEKLISDNVRKNVFKILNGNLGRDPKKKRSPEVKKQLKLASKPQTHTKVRATLSKTEKTAIVCEEILIYLNEKTGKKFKTNAESNLKNIKARISEGYQFNDFIKVIDKKNQDWNGITFSNGQQGSNYLRPTTLFTSKNFENYLNESSVKSDQSFKSDLDRDLFKFFEKNGCVPS